MSDSPAPNRGPVVVAAAIGINLILGSLYAWGVIAKTLIKSSHWENADAALPFTVSTATFAFTMIFAGRAQDKAGPKIVASVGGVVFALGLFLSAYATTPLAMALSYGILGGIGIGICYSATMPPSVKWFPPARKGLITGLVVAGVGLAAVYASPLLAFLLGQFGLSNTFLIMGAGALVLIPIFAQLLQNPPPGYVPAQTPAAPGAPAKAAAPRREADWQEMLKTGRFYCLWLMLTLSAAAGLMMIAHVGIIAQEQAKWAWGFVPIGILAIFNTLGRIAAGYGSDKIGRAPTMILVFVLQAINMFCFAQYTTPNLLIFGAAATGLCYGTVFTLMPAALVDYYGVRNLGVNYGLLFTAFGMAGVVGPYAAGKIHDANHSYNLAYNVSGTLLLVAAALAIGLALRAPKREEPAPLPPAKAPAA